MVKLIEADTHFDAWVEAVKFLLDAGRTLNVVLAIKQPQRSGMSQSAVDVIDKFLVSNNQLPVNTVAETIFPGSEYRTRGLRGVFKTYPDGIYPIIQKHRKISWGTYAYRLVRRSDARGNNINPLKQMIDKMNNELAQTRTKISCYELGVAEGEYDLPLYFPVEDGSRRMGGPCLSHLSFKLFDGAVHLTAVYRSHDYTYKVPGNLLGLARLQECVARETNQRIGSLVVHSTYASLSSTKLKIRKLIRDVDSPTNRKDETDVMAR